MSGGERVARTAVRASHLGKVFHRAYQHAHGGVCRGGDDRAFQVVVLGRCAEQAQPVDRHHGKVLQVVVGLYLMVAVAQGIAHFAVYFLPERGGGPYAAYGDGNGGKYHLLRVEHGLAVRLFPRSKSVVVGQAVRPLLRICRQAVAQPGRKQYAQLFLHRCVGWRKAGQMPASSTTLSTAAISPSGFLPPAVAKWGCPPPPP